MPSKLLSELRPIIEHPLAADLFQQRIQHLPIPDRDAPQAGGIFLVVVWRVVHTIGIPGYDFPNPVESCLVRGEMTDHLLVARGHGRLAAAHEQQACQEQYDSSCSHIDALLSVCREIQINHARQCDNEQHADTDTVAFLSKHFPERIRFPGTRFIRPSPASYHAEQPEQKQYGNDQVAVIRVCLHPDAYFLVQVFHIS